MLYMQMNSPELIFNFLRNTVHSTPWSRTTCCSWHLLEILLKVLKSTQRCYWKLARKQKDITRKYYSRYVNMMDSSVEYKIRFLFGFFFSFWRKTVKNIHRINYIGEKKEEGSQHQYYCLSFLSAFCSLWFI